MTAAADAECGRPAGHALERLPGRFAITRLPPDAPWPGWLAAVMNARVTLCSITRTDQELSILCPEEGLPAEITAERGFIALQVQGPLDFAEIGILNALTAPLATAGISVFALSTFDTDYLLLRANLYPQARECLAASGFSVPATG